LDSAQESQGKILIVDDNPLTRMVISEILGQEGFAVEEAENGERALSLFSEYPFDIILLDVLMPGLDGFTACARLRETPTGMRVPIVMITALGDELSVRRAYGVGATDFITKPINAFILIHRVRYILRASAAMRELSWRLCVSCPGGWIFNASSLKPFRFPSWWRMQADIAWYRILPSMH